MENVFFKLSLEKELRAEIKKEAVNKDTTMNKLIIEYIKKGLKMTGSNKRKIKAKTINHKFSKAKNATKKYNSLKDMAGIIKLDHETDSVKLKNSIYTDKARF